MPLAGRLAALCGAFGRAIAAAPAAAQSLSAADREKIGLAALIDRLGAAAPDGSGVLVSQVEAPLTLNGSDYRPDPTYFPGDTIVAKNGGTYSTHALGVGLGWYGSVGVAPGVSNVEVWNANSWQLNVLRLGSRFAPTTDTRKVANFSWYGNFADTDDALNAIARLDLVAERDKVVIVTAVNNGAGTAVPQFPASLYNGITVGLSSGASSKGPTTLAPGRSKPDLVAPASSTSIGAAWVSGAAAILVEAASGNAHALEPTTIKALLMAGATKTEFDLTDATPSTSDDWSHTPTQPLDARYGAGELNIDNSHRIFAAGEQAASDTIGVGLAGWDYGAASPSNLQQYILTIPEGRVAQTVSVIAAWERHIDFTQGPPGGEATLTPSLANLDLTLTRLSGPGAGATLAQSLSTV
ncbi:MAG: hypothetical protein JNG90_14175, partial [Planctomycetaceae bacterium]|nr:hypothetical protein [Planctomycetaceae bacterium]